VIPRLGPDAVPRLNETAIDGRVLAFTVGISLLAGLMFGLAPAITAWKTQVFEVLKAEPGTSSSAAGGVRLRSMLAASELALAIILLTGSGLMIKSFWRMNTWPTGFAPDKILVMRITLSGPRYHTWPPKQAYTEQLLQSLSSLAGVEAAGVVAGSLNTSIQVGGTTSAAPGEGVFASIRGVSTGYLRAMGVPLVKGAWPPRGSLFGVVVNETFARQVAGEAVGRRIGGAILNDSITGVVADFKAQQLDAEPLPEVYIPYERMPLSLSMRVVVRTTVDARALASAVRELASGIDRTQPVFEFQTLEDALASSIAPRRFNLFLLIIFASTALLLAQTGTYGVIAYSVSLRTREIGIRLALGAHRTEILGMVVKQGMSLALAGIATGVVAASVLTRMMTALLYDVKPNDPWVLAVASAALAGTALLAAVGPALKAAHVDPLTALRYE
jgi:putative ABC transport system permease protein